MAKLTKGREWDKKRDEFVSVTAHELRTPINVNRWTIELLLSGDVGDLTLEQRELVNQLQKSNQRMIGLVNDLLEILRIDEGRFVLKKKPIDLIKLASSVLGEMSIMMREKNLNLVWQKPKKPIMVRGDERRLAQVYRNLLSNAIKYNRQGGEVTLKIYEEKMAKEGEGEGKKVYLVSEVGDRGMGIPHDWAG